MLFSRWRCSHLLLEVVGEAVIQVLRVEQGCAGARVDLVAKRHLVLRMKDIVSDGYSSAYDGVAWKGKRGR